MQRNVASFGITGIDIFKQQMLNWANQFTICCFLDNHHYKSTYNTYECLVGVGAETIFAPTDNILNQLHTFTLGFNDWLFGNISYDLKNEIESLSSNGTDNSQYPTLFLFQPSVVIELVGGIATISSLTILPQVIFEQISSCRVPALEPAGISKNIVIKPRIEKAAYIKIIEKLRKHILKGDCYEVNFCQEFFAENTLIDPSAVYNALVQLSPTPFSCYYKLDDKYLLCASPERYIKKTGNVIISQPIKGTAKRNKENHLADEKLKRALQSSEKECSENVMVVDLVRNDLSKICSEGTVVAEELFGLYSFPQVHQLISTITGVLGQGISFADILKATFPMGSMTGAPKKRVMELIEQYEPVKRGMFSGAVGYIKPGGDFDFNVVIRSILYNAQTHYLNYFVGGAITFYSNPELEYEECILKAQAIEQVLKQQ